MLALKQALSLGKTFDEGIGWSPLDEASLEAWYQKGVGITLNGSAVSDWADSSTNTNTMRQTTEANQPEYSGGVLTFEATATSFLVSATDITLADAFTIGVRLNITSAGGVILGDNTEDGELIKVFSSTKISVRIDNQTRVDIQLDSGSLLGTEAYMVLSRQAPSDEIFLYWNGTKQADTEIMSGTANIDAIGVRKEELNPFDGTIREIQIYSYTSDVLIGNVNASLADL